MSTLTGDGITAITVAVVVGTILFTILIYVIFRTVCEYRRRIEGLEENYHAVEVSSSA